MTNIYRLDKHSMTDAAKHVSYFLEDSENMEVQCLSTFEGAYIIQARVRHGKVKKLFGMDKAISVKLTPIGNEFFSVDIGEAKWLDKGVALTVSWFVLWPLAVTSSYGIYKQKALPDKIFREIAIRFLPECKIA